MMMLPTVIGQAAATTRLDRLGQGVALMVVGMLVVFCALCLVAGTIALLNRFLGFKSHHGQQTTPVGATGLNQAPDSDARLRVVLAAAAAVAVGRAVRVHRVAPSKG